MTPGTYHPILECLEDRTVPYTLSAYKWGNPSITASFMPNGTQIGSSHVSDLIAKYDAVYSRTIWQQEFSRALQTWASVAPLTFRIVADNGSPAGMIGKIQGDPRFGDIRFGAYVSSSGYFATTYYPYTSTTRGGDVTLNSNQVYKIGRNWDLYSILLHETGHALGMGHSSVRGSAMYQYVTGVYTKLHADDVAGIQAKYGKRLISPPSSAARDQIFSGPEWRLATIKTLPEIKQPQSTIITKKEFFFAEVKTKAVIDYWKWFDKLAEDIEGV